MYTFLLFVQNISTLLVILSMFYIMRQRPSYVQKDLVLLNMALLIALMSYTLEMQAKDIGTAITAVKIGYIGKPIILFSMFFLIIDFAQIQIRNIFRTVSAAVQVIFIVVVFTFERHGLFYTSVKFVNDGLFPHLEKGRGPLYVFYMAIVFAYCIGMIVTCLIKAKRSLDKNDRRLLVLFGVIILLPQLGYILYISGVTKGYNAMILGFALDTIVFTFIYKNYRIFETVNIAWEKVFKFIGAGLLVYDHYGSLIYQNDMAKEMDIADKADELYKSREYVFHNDKVYRVEKLRIASDGNNLGYAYYIDNETDNYNYEAMLREEKKRADDANVAKTQFLSSMSHDIRTPMNAILGLTDIARMHLDERDKVEDSLKKINTSGKHLIELINEVLDINKIESGKFELMEDEFDIVGLTEEISMMSKSLVEAKKHTLSIDTSGVDHSWICGDKSRLSQVIMNLVSNSVKYTNNGGLIILNISETKSTDSKGKYRIIVRDNGIGMSEEYLPTIFEPFTRADDEVVYKAQGTGLGMSITKQFVELMGGTIEVRSTLGIGTTFEILLPLKYGDEANKKVETTRLADIASMDFTGKRVLVVEDNAVNAEIMGEFLDMTGIGVEFAKDGTEAVALVSKAEDNYYDLIFMDVLMPKMNGYEATKAIREMDRTYTKEVPIIAVTANVFAEDINEAINAGMTSHIIKPIEYDKLYEVLAEYC